MSQQISFRKQPISQPPKGKGQKSGHLPGTASTRTAKLIQLTITISPLGTEHTVISVVKAKGRANCFNENYCLEVEASLIKKIILKQSYMLKAHSGHNQGIADICPDHITADGVLFSVNFLAKRTQNLDPF